jgi:four helix bundle protein
MRSPIRTFRELQAWQAAMDLVMCVYQRLSELPPEERFGLAMQIRRAAVSIPSNIAEGHAFRTRPRAYQRHVRIALGSFAELETQLELSTRLHMLKASSIHELNDKMERVGKLLHGLLRALRAIKEEDRR